MPSVSFFFDTIASIVQIFAHERCPEEFHLALFPQVFILCQVLEQQLVLLKIHTIHNEYVGSKLADMWKALQAQLHMQGSFGNL